MSIFPMWYYKGVQRDGATRTGGLAFNRAKWGYSQKFYVNFAHLGGMRFRASDRTNWIQVSYAHLPEVDVIGKLPVVWLSSENPRKKVYLPSWMGRLANVGTFCSEWQWESLYPPRGAVSLSSWAWWVSGASPRHSTVYGDEQYCKLLVHNNCDNRQVRAYCTLCK